METIDYDGPGSSEYSCPSCEHWNCAWDGLLQNDEELLNEREMGRQHLWASETRHGGLHEGNLSGMEISQIKMQNERAKTKQPLFEHSPRTKTMAKAMSSRRRHNGHKVTTVVALLAAAVPVSAVLIPFDNCLSESWRKDTPLRLQFIPEFVEATFDTTNSAHSLEILTYINVNGTFPGTPYPPPPPSDTEYWQGNSSDKGGKIVDVPFRDGANKRTTASTSVTLLSYEPYHIDQGFCDFVQNGTCPLGPRFGINE